MKIRKICELLNYYYFIKCKKLAKTLRFFQKWTRGAPSKYKPGLIYFFLKSMENEIIVLVKYVKLGRCPLTGAKIVKPSL